MSNPQDIRNRASRYQRSFSGMVGAMLLLVLLIGAFVIFRDANRNDPADPVEPVDWRSAATYAREQADFEVLAPDRLPSGWIATSVRFGQGDEQSWHLGVLTDEKRYIGLEQGPDPASSMAAQFIDEDAEADGEVQVSGQTWEVWRDDTDTALVRESDGGVTTLVVGTVGLDQLEDYVDRLA